jgi:hypothetical protein
MESIYQIILTTQKSGQLGTKKRKVYFSVHGERWRAKKICFSLPILVLDCISCLVGTTFEEKWRKIPTRWL